MTRQLLSWMTIGLLAAVPIALAQGADDEQAIRELASEWQDLYNRQDYQAVTELYTEEAIYYDVDGSVHHGRESIQVALNELPVPPDGAITIDLTLDETEIVGDTAYVSGSYRLLLPDGSELTRGNWLTIDRLVDGEWRIFRHIGNMVPAQPAAGG